MVIPVNASTKHQLCASFSNNSVHLGDSAARNAVNVEETLAFHISVFFAHLNRNYDIFFAQLIFSENRSTVILLIKTIAGNYSA